MRSPTDQPNCTTVVLHRGGSRYKLSPRNHCPPSTGVTVQSYTARQLSSLRCPRSEGSRSTLSPRDHYPLLTGVMVPAFTARPLSSIRCLRSKGLHFKLSSRDCCPPCIIFGRRGRGPNRHRATVVLQPGVHDPEFHSATMVVLHALSSIEGVTEQSFHRATSILHRRGSRSQVYRATVVLHTLSLIEGVAVQTVTARPLLSIQGSMAQAVTARPLSFIQGSTAQTFTARPLSSMRGPRSKGSQFKLSHRDYCPPCVILDRRGRGPHCHRVTVIFHPGVHGPSFHSATVVLHALSSIEGITVQAFTAISFGVTLRAALVGRI